MAVAQFYNSYSEWAMSAQDDIIRWANPLLGDDYPTKTWVMARLDHALLAVALYLLVVIIGIVRLSGHKPQNSSAPPKQQSVLQSFLSDPLKIVAALYNVGQVLLCLFMIVGTVLEAMKKDYSLICNSFTPSEEGMAFMTWVFYMSKLYDFTDTVLIVLRGKWAQFSFLHIYHHITIFMFYWLNINAAYDGDVYYTIIANGFVHLVMYYYYLLTSFGIRPWWKKYVTMLQMLQFVTMISQAVYNLINGCAYPRNVTLMYLFYIISLYILFNSFFKKSYRKPKSS